MLTARAPRCPSLNSLLFSSLLPLMHCSGSGGVTILTSIALTHPLPAQYSEFYQIDHVMILGRVSKGAGGDLMMATAKKVLETEFPEIKRAPSLPPTAATHCRHKAAAAPAVLIAEGPFAAQLFSSTRRTTISRPRGSASRPLLCQPSNAHTEIDYKLLLCRQSTCVIRHDTVFCPSCNY